MGENFNDQSFKIFAVSLEAAIKRYAQKDDVELLERQKIQVDSLVAFETEFRDWLVNSCYGFSIYNKFIKYICTEVGNILVSRPYFRERKDTFNKYISKALKSKDIHALYKFRINYQFIKFVLACRDWAPGSKLTRIVAKIEKIRTALLIENMPLAISRAHIFWRKTPKNHLDYMDLIQISAEGLMTSIDKFVPPFGKVFRAVAIGRVTGNLIRDYSSTLLHFWPTDQKKIYRANKLAFKVSQGMSQEDMVDLINDGMSNSQKTNISEINNLISAASTVSAESQPVNSSSKDNGGETHNTSVLGLASIPEENQPDKIVESQNALSVLCSSVDELSVYERKILKMKGVDFCENYKR